MSFTKYTARFQVKEGGLLPRDLEAYKDFSKDKLDIVVSITISSLHEKPTDRMQAYYFGPFLDWAVPRLRETGMPVSEGSARMFFEARFAIKEWAKVPMDGGEIISLPILEKMGTWSAKRWHDFLNDIIYFSNEHFSDSPPDASEYLEAKRLKRKQQQ